jgi:GTP-binding protein HflX
MLQLKYIFSKIKNKYNVEEFEYVETGIELTVELDEEDYNIYKQYIINE